MKTTLFFLLLAGSQAFGQQLWKEITIRIYPGAGDTTISIGPQWRADSIVNYNLGYGAGYTKGFADGQATATHDTVRIHDTIPGPTVYMIPTGKYRYVHTQTFPDSSSVTIPEGTIPLSSTWTSSTNPALRKLVLRTLQPIFRKP